MTDILYSLIYIVPLILIAAKELIVQLVDAETVSESELLIPMLLVACLLTSLVNVSNKVRVIILASLAALMAGVLLVTDSVMRREWTEANSWIWVVLAVTALSVALEVLMLKLRAVKLTVGALLLATLVSSYWTGIISEKISVVSIIFLVFTILLEEVRRHTRGSDLMQSFVVRVVPFLIVGMVGLYYMPHSDYPYDWALARRIYNKISDDITIFLQSFDKDDSANGLMNRLGFSESARISGDASGSPELMMNVSMGYMAPHYLYLDGKYFEDFDGREWAEATSSYPYMMDMIETLSALSKIDSGLINDYRRVENLTVTYSGQNTRYAFAPVKTNATKLHIDDITADYSGNEIVFDKKQGYLASYRLEYLLLNRNENTLPKLIEAGSSTDEKTWNGVRTNLGLKEEAYSYENFLSYRTALYDYSLCPHAVTKEKLSPKVLEFLGQATKGAQNDYEKLCGLEKAFNGFEYTTQPGAMPDKVKTPADFLDYFITESGRGYCNSFATAFVLLCQAEGIPARYVHGYLVPKAEGEVSPVYSTMAHAYAEAYIKGIGWMVFDATPGCLISRSWDEKGNFEVPTSFDYHPGYNYSDSSETVEVMEDEPKSGLRWYMIAIPLALTVLALAAVVLIERAVNGKRYRRLTREEQTYERCMWIMRMMKLEGFTRADCETVSEYAARAYDEKKLRLLSFAKAFEKVLYSTECITDEEAAALKEEYNEVYARLKGRNKAFADILRFMRIG